MKKRYIILVTALVVGILGFGFYTWQKHRYVMPAGYTTAVATWQNQGLPDPADRTADGSRERPYDVIVWGAEPEGITAAVAASRNGLHTLLVDHRDSVGGLFILGQLNFIDMNDNDKGRLVTRGIFEEYYKKVGGMVFDLGDGRRVFEEMIAGEPLLTLELNTRLQKPVVAGGRVTSLLLEREGAAREVYGKVFIDASQDADLAWLAGVPFTEGFEDIGLPGVYQACTLVFSVRGINWPRVMWETLVAYRRGSSGATLNAAWGYDKYIRGYTPESEVIGFRGFNMARQKDGQVLLNGLLIYGADFDDPGSLAAARQEAEKEARRFIAYARENIPGFKEAEVSGFAPELYVRQSRHMVALYRLTIDDVLENRDQWDRIGYGSYPVDIQSIARGQPGFVVGNPLKYALPFRSLVPPNFNNLLVVGRSAGYDSLAHGSVRVVPPGMVAAQAAGVASAYALATGKTFHQVAAGPEDITFIRDMLERQGAFVAPQDSRPGPETQHPGYRTLRELRRLGLAPGGYDNDYKLDQPMSRQAFLNLLYNGGFRRLNLAGREDLAGKLYFVITKEEGMVTPDNIGDIFYEFERFNPHLKQLYKPEELAQTYSVLADTSGSDPAARAVLYEVTRSYLELLARAD
jgi:hypothetical protein